MLRCRVRLPCGRLEAETITGLPWRIKHFLNRTLAQRLAEAIGRAGGLNFFSNCFISRKKASAPPARMI
jgi:hypothetical protein